MKSHKIFEILVLAAIFAVYLICIQMSIVLYRTNNLKIETHYRYLLPRDGQCQVKRLKLDGKYDDRMVCHWELK